MDHVLSVQRVRARRVALAEVLQNFSPKLDQTIAAVAQRMHACLSRGGTVFACGNGGSASDAQHFVAELVGRYQKERRALAAVALSVNSSTITAVANDYGYERVFARQLEALGRKGDMLLALSTSGRSPNVVAAAKTARALGVWAVGLTGSEPRNLGPGCDDVIAVPSNVTAHIQEAHIMILHTLAECFEAG